MYLSFPLLFKPCFYNFTGYLIELLLLIEFRKILYQNYGRNNLFLYYFDYLSLNSDKIRYSSTLSMIELTVLPSVCFILFFNIFFLIKTCKFHPYWYSSIFFLSFFKLKCYFFTILLFSASISMLSFTVLQSFSGLLVFTEASRVILALVM